MSASEYRTYYESQLGGQLHVFRGGLQSGAGLGDVLRGLFRFLAPIALRGVRAFAGSALAAHQSGVPLALAAKGALGPTLRAVAGSAAPTVSSLINKVVPGLIANEVKTAAQPHVDASSKQEGSGGAGALFQGVDGIPVTDKAVKQYKRGGSQRPKTSKRTKSGKTVDYNF